MRTIKNLVGAALIAIAVFLFWVLILPDYDDRSYYQAALEARMVNFEAKNKLITKTLELDKEYQSKYAELKRLSLVIPPEKHIEEMITILEEIFLATGIPLKDMSLSVTANSANPAYDLVDMQFNFTTNYDSIINFLNAIEKSLRLIDTTRLSVSVNKEEITGRGPLPLDVGFNAKAYFLSKNSLIKSVAKPSKSEE